MTVAAYRGVGTILKLGDGATPEVFTTIAGVRSITGPTASAEEIDVSSLSSTGNYREKIAGFKDPGQMTFSLNFIPSSRQGLYELFESGATANFQVHFSDSATIMSLTASVTGFSLSIPTDDAITADVTLTLTGALTWNN